MTEENPLEDGTVHQIIVSAAGVVFTFVFLAALGAVVYGTMIGEGVWTITGAAMLALTAGAAVYLKRRLDRAAHPSGQED